MTTPLRVLGLAGSLRQASSNRALLRAAVELAPEDLVVESFDLLPIPLYDGDVEARGLPGPVQDLRTRIAAADALLIATPEYNHSVSGVLKNAIDWASRPPAQPLAGKPVAIMGASSGLWGTARAQGHLRQILAPLDLHLVNQPQVLVAQAGAKIDAEGRLSDEPTRQLISQLLVALAAWTRRLGSGPRPA